MFNGNHNYTIRIHMKVWDIDCNVVEFKDDTAIRNADIWENSFTVDSATSEGGELSVGSVIASQLKFGLVNDEDRFDYIDFIDGAISLWIGMEMEDGAVEEELYGVYTITEATFSDGTIDIVALDNISKLAHDYVSTITYPATLDVIASDCCNACGVVLDGDSIPPFMKEFSVQSKPDDNLNYAEVISFIAQIAGCFVKCTHDGKLMFGWYDISVVSEVYDGGTFKYDGRTETLDKETEADGGSFAYNDGDDIDGGDFVTMGNYHDINNTFTFECATDDVAITGVKVTSTSTDSEIEADSYLAGTEGYVIEINSNPLIQLGQSTEVATHIYSVMKKMRFRPLNVTTLPNPMIEAGDVGVVADYKGIYYPCFFSTVTFSTDNPMSLICDAQSRNRNDANIKSALNQVLQKSKEFVAYEKSAREVALENMNTLMSNALGYFSTSVTQASGGQITYIHNKPNLDDSNIRWCFTEQGFMVSTDYGQTWRAGFDSSGNAVVNVLSAVGINADWINAGTITGRTISGGTINGATITSVGSDGQSTIIQGGTLTTNNANITGGSIAISTQSSSTDIIELNSSDGSSTGITSSGMSTSSGGYRAAYGASGYQVYSPSGDTSYLTPTMLGLNGKRYTELVSPSDLSSYATKGELSSYATRSELSGYATQSDLAGKANSTHTHKGTDVEFTAYPFAGENLRDVLLGLRDRIKALEDKVK